MENFFKIRAEKQTHILKASFMVFGKYGYRKASVADIATEAGITKGMVLYYFGSKKVLYMYLIELCQTHLFQTAKERLGVGATDFFERLKIVVDLQMEAIGKYPALLGFMNTAFCETDPEVKTDIERIFDTEFAGLDHMLLDGSDFSALKPGHDPRLICKFILWANYGFLAYLFDTVSPDKAGETAGEYFQCLDIMRDVLN